MLKKRTKKWFNAVMFIVVIVALAIVAAAIFPELVAFVNWIKFLYTSYAF